MAVAVVGIAGGGIAPAETAQGLTRSVAGHLGLAAFYASGILALGLGSILARRWARDLLLCGGGLAGWIGLLAFAEICWHAVGGPAGEHRLGIESAIVLLNAILICLGVPIATVCFYWRQDVRQTCLRRDPQERWTDRCPLPVLSCCILQVLIAIIYLAAAVEGAPFPFFGIPLGGGGAVAAQLLVFVLAIGSARAFYRGHRLAWPTYTGMFVVLSVAALAGTGWNRFRSPFGSHLSFSVAGSALLDTVQLGYLLYARRFFVARSRA